MTQQSGNQFDDDLTVGTDSNGAVNMDSVDLFEFGSGDESPIARLKSIILSIDWEITDEILTQLDDELVDLGDIWAGDKFKQVYVQGLSKIGKYIYKEKANAHPDSIKLLITFFHNLEKIVTADDSMGQDEKKNILLEDVKKFDQLKSQIVQSTGDTPAQSVAESGTGTPGGGDGGEDLEALAQLKGLKAQILGIDWEINDQELQKLDDEVQRLQGMFSDNQGQRIMLQGIGALSGYVQKMRSQSNGQAFSLLHSFYGVLEKVSTADLPSEEEKDLLLAEVGKFNDFKAEIAKEQVESVVPASSEEVPPAAVAEEDLTEPQSVAPSEFVSAEEDGKLAADVESQLASVFGDDEEEAPSFAEGEGEALAGVDVETEADDDSDEAALPYEDGGVAPALADAEEESSFSVDQLAEEPEVSPTAKEDIPSPPEIVAEVVEERDLVEDEISETLASSFGADDEGEDLRGVASDSAAALEGVDVETEADDDSDEDALPLEGGKLAPALAGNEEETGFVEEDLGQEVEEAVPDDLEDRLGAFFDDEVAASTPAGVTDVATDEGDGVADEDDLVAALSDYSEEDDFGEGASFLADEENLVGQVADEELSFLDEEVTAPVEDFGEAPSEEPAPALSSDDADVATSSDDEVLEAAITDEVEEASGVEGETEEALSFLDEETPEDVDGEEQPTELTEELEEPDVEGETPEEEGIAVQEETLAAEDIEESVDQELAFLDEDEKAPLAEEKSGEESPAGDIDFTVPGEDVALAVDDETSEMVDDEEGDIEFDVPGEVALAGGAAALAATTGAVTGDKEEVVFDAVEDDVEIDPLPGEEFVELESTDILDREEGGKYPVLGSAISQVIGDISEENINGLYTEINSLRASADIGHGDKMFLQLLSSVAQRAERSLAQGSDGYELGLLKEILAGLEMGEGAGVQAQEKLLTCMTSVLHMQEKEIGPVGQND